MTAIIAKPWSIRYSEEQTTKKRYDGRKTVTINFFSKNYWGVDRTEQQLIPQKIMLKASPSARCKTRISWNRCDFDHACSAFISSPMEIYPTRVYAHLFPICSGTARFVVPLRFSFRFDTLPPCAQYIPSRKVLRQKASAIWRIRPQSERVHQILEQCKNISNRNKYGIIQNAFKSNLVIFQSDFLLPYQTVGFLYNDHMKTTASLC